MLCWLWMQTLCLCFRCVFLCKLVLLQKETLKLYYLHIIAFGIWPVDTLAGTSKDCKSFCVSSKKCYLKASDGCSTHYKDGGATFLLFEQMWPQPLRLSDQCYHALLIASNLTCFIVDTKPTNWRRQLRPNSWHRSASWNDYLCRTGRRRKQTEVCSNKKG